MNPLRYRELLGRLFDGGLSEREAEELAAGLAIDGDLRRDLRRQLVLWEMWSQSQAAERSSAAFVEAWKTRLAAETEVADVFADAVRARLSPLPGAPAGLKRFVQRVRDAKRPLAALAWAASAFILAMAAAFWFAGSRSAHARISLEGEAVCTACVLHESHEHAPALRVGTGAAAQVYYIERSPEVAALQDYFCGGPTAANVEGTKRFENGRQWINATNIKIRSAREPSDASTNSARKIFPI